MSKKLISLVLAVAMVMSMFCIIASADEVETAVKPTLTYYFLAPDDFGGAGAYWWEDGGCGADWPGVAMTAVPEIGKNVYSVEVSALVGTIIFNENVNGGQQTVNLGVTEATTGKKNVANKIFVAMGKQEDNGQLTGEWFSLNPNDSDYYRVASSYAITGDTEQQFYPEYDAEIVAGEDFKAPATATYYFFAPDSYAEAEEAYSYENDVKVPEVPTWTPAAVSGEVPEEETEDEPVIEGISFFFKPDGEIFTDSGNINFYVWDATANKRATKSGWSDDDTWGSKKKIGGTKVEVDGVTMFQSYNIDIDNTHDVFCIVQQGDNQTFDCVLTSAANEKVLSLTGNMLENPVDSKKQAIEAAFDGVEGCGPHKVITSSAKIVGTTATANDNYTEQLAGKIADCAVVKDKETGAQSLAADWTREAVKALETAFELEDEKVAEALEAVVKARNEDTEPKNDISDEAAALMATLLQDSAPSGDGDAAAPYAYWWEAGGCGADWPGVQMEACPTIGKHVYKISGVSLEVVTIIFNNGNHDLQTINLNIEKGTTGFNNVNNKIFMITKDADTKSADGVWMSLDPRDDDYYRNALKPEDDNTDSDTVETPETPDPTKDTDSDAVETPETPETPDQTKDTDSDNTDSDNTDSDNTDSDNTDSDAVETPETPETPDQTKDSDTDTSGKDNSDTDTGKDNSDTDTGKDNSDTDTSTDTKPGDKTKKGKLGDVDDDGDITANDALEILRASLGMEPGKVYIVELANVDGDSAVDAVDANSVLRKSVEIKAADTEKIGTEVEYKVA